MTGFDEFKQKISQGSTVVVLLFLVYCIIVYITEYENNIKTHIFQPQTVIQSIRNTNNEDSVRQKEKDIDIGRVVSDSSKEIKLASNEATTKITKMRGLSMSVQDKYIKEMQLKNIKVDDVNECRKRRILVYNCGKNLCGGWGDRLKGIVSTFILALLTNRTFVIDVSKPCDLDQFLEEHIYKWAICKNYTRSLTNSTSENGTVHTGAASAFWKKIKNLDNDTKWDSRVIVLRSNAYIINALRRHKDSYKRLEWLLQKRNDEIISLILHTLFKAGMELTVDLNNFAAVHFKNKHVVCSHIRVGKNPSNPNDSALPKGGPNTTTVLTFLSRFNKSDKFVIYIASDSENVKTEASRLYSNFVNANRTIIHVDRPDSKRSKATICDGFYNLLFEQYLLTSCDTLVLTRSNFGAMAAYMRGNSENLFLFQNATNSIINVTLPEMQSIYQFV